MKVSLAYVFIAAASSIAVVNSESNPRHRFLKKESKVSKSETSKSKSSKSKSSKSGSVDLCVGKVDGDSCGDVPFDPANLCTDGICRSGSCLPFTRGILAVPDGAGGFCVGECDTATGDYVYGGACGIEESGTCNPTTGACE